MVTFFFFFLVLFAVITKVNFRKEAANEVCYHFSKGSDFSVAKSVVFPWNWATLTLLPRVVFLVRGLKRPQ